MASVAPATESRVVKVTLQSVNDQPGIAAGIFSTLGEQGINIDLITGSAVGVGKSDVSFVISQNDLPRVKELLPILMKDFGAESVAHDPNVAIVALHVAELVQTPGTAGRMFAALSGQGINIDMISTSMASITCLIPEDRIKDAVKVLEEEFGK